MNGDLAEVMSMVNGTSNNFVKHGSIDMAFQANTRVLKEPYEVCKVHDLNEDRNSKYIKQRGTLWFQKCKESLITGSTAYKGLGLSKLYEERQHYEEFVEGKEPKSPTSRCSGVNGLRKRT